jgi:hypothetical protein
MQAFRHFGGPAPYPVNGVRIVNMSMESTLIGLLFLVLGALVMLGSAFNWGLICHPGKLLPRLLGVPAAQFVSFVVGIYLFVAGIERLIGADWF